MAQSKLKRSELSKAVKEVNDIMQPNPAINTKAEKDELETKLIEAGELVDPEQDDFSDATWKVLETLGAAHRPKNEGSGEGEQEADGNDSDEEAGEKEEPKQQPQSSNKGKGKKKEDNKGKKKDQQKSSNEGKKKTKVQERIEFLTPLIQEGKYTKKELVQKLQEQFDMSTSAAQTLLTDAKNSKYTKFHTVVVEDENKVMSFKED